MKSRTKVIAAAAVGIGLAAIPAHSQVLSLPVLYSILAQIQQEVAQARAIYQGVVNTKEEIVQAANYVRHPQSWKQYLDTATSIAAVSNGADHTELQRINSMLRATREAYAQFSYQQLSAGDMVRVNQLGAQMMDLQQRSDTMTAGLQSVEQYQNKVSTDGDWGCVSCTLGAHQR